MKFNVGDICVTRGSSVPLLNDNVTVVVIGVNPTMNSHLGAPTPYLIRRVDGEVWGLTTDATTGAMSFFQFQGAWCSESRLRRIDEPSTERSVTLANPNRLARSESSDT